MGWFEQDGLWRLNSPLALHGGREEIYPAGEENVRGS